MENQIKNLSHSELKTFLNQNSKLSENEKKILLNLKEAISSHESKLKNTKSLVKLTKLTSDYRMGIEKLSDLLITFINQGKIDSQFPVLPTFRIHVENENNINDAQEWINECTFRLQNAKIPCNQWFNGILDYLNPNIKDWIIRNEKFSIERMSCIHSEIQWKSLFVTPFINEFTGLVPIYQRVLELIKVQSRDVFDIQAFVRLYQDTSRRINIRDDDMLGIFLFLNALPTSIKLQLEEKVSNMVSLGELSLGTIMELAIELETSGLPKIEQNVLNVHYPEKTNGMIPNPNYSSPSNTVKIVKVTKSDTRQSDQFKKIPIIKETTNQRIKEKDQEIRLSTSWVFSDISIQKHMELLGKEAERADFSIPSKFPINLIPIFVNCINAALDVGVYEKHFYEHLAAILPISSFALRKFAVQLVYPDRIERLKKELEKVYEYFPILVKKEHRPVSLLLTRE